MNEVLPILFGIFAVMFLLGMYQTIFWYKQIRKGEVPQNITVVNFFISVLFAALPIFIFFLVMIVTGYLQ